MKTFAIMMALAVVSIASGCASEPPTSRDRLPDGSPYVEAVALLGGVSEAQAIEAAYLVQSVHWRCDSIHRARYLAFSADVEIQCDSGRATYVIQWRRGTPYVCPSECLSPSIWARMFSF